MKLVLFPVARRRWIAARVIDRKFLIKNLEREILSANYADFLRVVEYIIH